LAGAENGCRSSCLPAVYYSEVRGRSTAALDGGRETSSPPLPLSSEGPVGPRRGSPRCGCRLRTYHCAARCPGLLSPRGRRSAAAATRPLNRIAPYAAHPPPRRVAGCSGSCGCVLGAGGWVGARGGGLHRSRVQPNEWKGRALSWPSFGNMGLDPCSLPVSPPLPAPHAAHRTPPAPPDRGSPGTRGICRTSPRVPLHPVTWGLVRAVGGRRLRGAPGLRCGVSGCEY
jgi:hypothetical protein